MAYNKPAGAPLRRNAPEQPTEWASDLQLAQRYAVSRATIWRWVKESRLPPPVRLASGTTRWRLSEVIEKLEG